jgi:hypothetical protein
MMELVFVYGGTAVLSWILIMWSALGIATLLAGFPRLKLWQLAGIVGVVAWGFALAVTMYGSSYDAGILLGVTVAGILLGFAWMWLNEFRALMLRRDDEFPGRYDKLVWSLALLLFAPAGVWLFRLYRKAQWPEKPVTRASEPDAEAGPFTQG